MKIKSRMKGDIQRRSRAFFHPRELSRRLKDNPGIISDQCDTDDETLLRSINRVDPSEFK